MKLKTKITIALTFTLSVLMLSAVCCMRRGIQNSPAGQSISHFEWVETQPDSLDAVNRKEKQHIVQRLSQTAPPEIKRTFVKYEYRLEYVFTKRRFVTCYTGKDPGDPGHMKYANNNFADRLHKHERKIRYEHNTVALCPEDKIYHEQLIQLADGTWTHKWRIHIDGVHKKERGTETDSVFFAVPRDRMRQKGRIDYLITQAGIYNSVEQRVANWRSIKRKCDFYEWRKYAIYSDNSEKRVDK